MDKHTKICSFDGCDNKHYGLGLCSGHYQQRRSGQELRPLQPKLTLEQRFWSKVNKDAPNGCWEWTGYITPQGYGLFWDGKKPNTTHRVSQELANGPIPEGMDIDHRCANRKCVNPEHLRVTTRSQNMQHQAGPRKDNTSGVRGVSWIEHRKAWRAEATLEGRQYYAGYHSTLEAADRAARALRAELFTHDDHDQWVASQAARRTATRPPEPTGHVQGK